MKNLIVILLIITLVVPFAYAVNEPEDALILYMPFDTIEIEIVDEENEKIRLFTSDRSKYGNDGEIMGDPKHVKGKFGKALELNGQNDWVVVPHDDILTVDKDVTVMAWINTERHMGPNDQRWQGIVAKGNSPRSYSFYTESPSGCLHLSVSGIGSICNGKVELNAWQHVTAQVEGNTHRYWLNGESVGEFGGKNPPPGKADTQNVLIGKTHEANREFLGLIDEVRIWNRALSEEEVNEQMNKGYLELFPVDPRHKAATTWGTIKSQKQ